MVGEEGKKGNIILDEWPHEELFSPLFGSMGPSSPWWAKGGGVTFSPFHPSGGKKRIFVRDYERRGVLFKRVRIEG